MKRLVMLAVLPLVLAAPDCAQAQAQPFPTSTTRSNSLELTYQLSLLREASVRQELQVSAEQVAQVEQLRGLLTTSDLRGGAADRTLRLAEQEKNTAEAKQKLAALLKPEQVARLQQIIRQQRRPNGLAALIGLADVRPELKLSEEQSNRATAIEQELSAKRRALFSDRTAYAAKSQELIAAADRDIEGLLNADQNARLKELLGPPFKGEIRLSFFGGVAPGGGSGGGPPGGSGTVSSARGFSLGTAVGPSLNLLRGEQVQQELKLTAEQKQKVAALPTSTRGTDPATLIEFLTPPQRERLDQLTLQYALQRYGPLAELRYKSAVEALALSEEQRQKIFTIARENEAAIAALQGTNAPDKVAAISRETSGKLDQALSEEQRAKRKQLVGELFAGQLQTGFPSRDAGGRGGAPVEAQTQPSTGSTRVGDSLTLTAQLALLSDASVQQELQLSAEQIGKIEPLRLPRESTTEFASWQAERKKQLDNLLKPEQAARLQQILRQDRRTLGWVAVAAFGDVQTELKFTAEQSAQLVAVLQWLSTKRRALNRDDPQYATKNQELIATADRELEGLLNAEQNARLKELLGPPFTGQLGPTSRGFGYTVPGGSRNSFRSASFSLGTTAGPSLALLRGQQAQQELKLTAAQKQKVAALPTPAPADPAALLDFLAPQQRERLDQLTLQYALQRYGPLGWLRYKAAVDSLALNDEQRQKIEEIAREYAAAIGASGSAALPSQVAAADRQTAEKLNQALSEEQRTKRKQLVGELFPGQLQAGSLILDASDLGIRPFEVGSSTRSPWIFLTYPDVQKDIKLTDEQRQKLPTLGQPFRAPPRAEQIQAALTAEQVARLWQVQLQILKRRSGPASIFRYRDVVEAITVTEEQKKSLAAVAEGGVGVGNGPTAEQHVAEILTEAQEAKVKELLGPAFEGQAGTPSAQFGNRFPGSPEIQIASESQSPGGWMRYPAVREDLKLSDEQTQKVNAILERERRIPPDKLADLLNAEQLARLREVQRQLVLRQSGAATLFRYREVAEPLALSDEQKQKIQQLARANSQLGVSTQTAQRIRTQLDEILTTEQRSQFDKLFGKPFEGDVNPGLLRPGGPASGSQRPAG